MHRNKDTSDFRPHVYHVVLPSRYFKILHNLNKLIWWLRCDVSVSPALWCACGSRGNRCSGGTSSRRPRSRPSSCVWRWWYREHTSSRDHYTCLPQEVGLEKHQLQHTGRERERERRERWKRWQGKENEKHKKDTQQREDNKTKRQRGKKINVRK